MKLKTRDRGAVAPMLALLTCFVLLTAGALAVDLGNAWARKRDSQRQVDVAALAAAHLLPVTTSLDRTAIAKAVVDSIKLTRNSVSGQSLGTVSASWMLSSSHITFQYQAVKHGPFVSCNVGSVCTQMTVTSPDARVQFGLGAVTGHSHVDVAKQAVVRVETQLPITKDVMPFWLPNGCSFGPAEPDTTQGNGNGNGGGGAGGGGAAAALAPEAAVSAGATAAALAAAAATPPGSTSSATPPGRRRLRRRRRRTS
jgi:Flp pilus assembly protein TadG